MGSKSPGGAPAQNLPHEELGTCLDSRDLIVGIGMRANRFRERTAGKRAELFKFSSLSVITGELCPCDNPNRLSRAA